MERRKSGGREGVKEMIVSSGERWVRAVAISLEGEFFAK